MDYRTQNAMILAIGTPRKGPHIVGQAGQALDQRKVGICDHTVDTENFALPSHMKQYHNSKGTRYLGSDRIVKIHPRLQLGHQLWVMYLASMCWFRA